MQHEEEDCADHANAQNRKKGHYMKYGISDGVLLVHQILFKMYATPSLADFAYILKRVGGGYSRVGVLGVHSLIIHIG